MILKKIKWLSFTNLVSFTMLSCPFCSIANNSTDLIQVLILSGRNNHDWQQTTPALKEIYEKSGRFVVEVTNNPAGCTAETLTKYDVIVSNWCAWPEVTGQRWDPATEKALLDFVREGKGFVLFHAASATHQDWPEFQQLIGATWDKKLTGHGRIHTFNVRIDDKTHPVTKGIQDFRIKDELWHRMAAQPTRKILCTAFSAKEQGGSGNVEPVVIYTHFEKGRCFHNVLGHNVETMQNLAWQTLMLRGTEWAATGKVTLPIPSNWPSTTNSDRDFSWQQTDTSLALLNHQHIVWQCNFPKKGKPYFHPVSSVDGVPLTWKSPPDHAWHHALWFSWKEINGLNYWEEDRKTGLAKGRTEVIDVKVFPNDNYFAKIELVISYHPPNELAVLTEKRLLHTSVPDDKGNYHIDWQSTFTAGNDDVELEREPIEGQKGGRRWGGYATLACRINTESLRDIKFLDSEGRIDLDIHTKPTHWVDVSGAIASDSSRAAGITIFDHPNNLRHPPPGYVIKDWVDAHKLLFAYMNPGFLYNEGFKLQAHQSFTLRYRIFVHRNRGDMKNLAKEFEQFASQ